MRRATASLLSCLLLLATYAFGGCISCERYFMWPGMKSCCTNGHCSRTTPAKSGAGRECKRIAFDCQKSFDHAVVLTIVAAISPGVPNIPVEPGTPRRLRNAIGASPPDFQALHSIFLI